MIIYKKYSLTYKFRKWINFLLGSLQVLHAIIMLVNVNDAYLWRESWGLLICAIILTLFNILVDYVVCTKDIVAGQIIMFICSCKWYSDAFPGGIMGVVIVIEVLILLFGMLFIYWRDYKESLFKRWKSAKIREAKRKKMKKK